MVKFSISLPFILSKELSVSSLHNSIVDDFYCSEIFSFKEAADPKWTEEKINNLSVHLSGISFIFGKNN